jgi:hypothetical protein
MSRAVLRYPRAARSDPKPKCSGTASPQVKIIGVPRYEFIQFPLLRRSRIGLGKPSAGSTSGAFSRSIGLFQRRTKTCGSVVVAGFGSNGVNSLPPVLVIDPLNAARLGPATQRNQRQRCQTRFCCELSAGRAGVSLDACSRKTTVQPRTRPAEKRTVENTFFYSCYWLSTSLTLLNYSPLKHTGG